MTWLLTVWMITVNDGAHKTEVGVMVNEDICNIAGRGFEAVLKAEDPTVEVMWKCDYLGAST